MSEDPVSYGSSAPSPRSRSIGDVVRPDSGWIRSVRAAHRLTLAEVARRLKVTPAAVRSFEQAEAEDRITLGSLRRVAEAMGCELIYALVPRTGTLANLAETAGRPSEQTAARQTRTTSENRDTDDAAKKVTDRTWRAQQDES